jgi:sec-independent protein translocase protein TatA
MPRIGPLGIWELLIILVVILLIFGPRRLPEMAKGIGQSVREFRKGIRDMKDDVEGAGKGEDAGSTKQRANVAERPAQAASQGTDGRTAESRPSDAKPAEATTAESKSA